MSERDTSDGDETGMVPTPASHHNMLECLMLSVVFEGKHICINSGGRKTNEHTGRKTDRHQVYNNLKAFKDDTVGLSLGSTW